MNKALNEIKLAIELLAHCVQECSIDQEGADMIGRLSEMIRERCPMDQLEYDHMQEDIWAMIDERVWREIDESR